ncbi:MAG TPA: TIGR03086 family metal-binding protein [Pseudonocardiaceae bacterium]
MGVRDGVQDGVQNIAESYYDAWRSGAGDMTGVPLAPDFAFTGPMASFDTADGYRAMAKQAGAAVRDFRVRHQFIDGELVCSILDWEMAMLPGRLTSAEVLRVRDGMIVSSELIYDAEELRKAMARPDIAALLDRSLRDTTAVFGAVDSWDVPSPCTGWTARQVGNHLAASIDLLTRVAEGVPVDPTDLDPRQVDTDRLGHRPAGTMGAIAARAVAAFAKPETLGRRFDLPAPDLPGIVLANLCLLESLVHGWDLATGAGVDYQPDDAVIAAVHGFASSAIGDDQRERGLFGPAVAIDAGADQLTILLGHLGRRA